MFEDVWRKEKEENVKIRFTVEHVEAREKFVKILEKGRGKDTRQNYRFNFTIYPPSINSCLKMFEERKKKENIKTRFIVDAWVQSRKIRENSRGRKEKRGKEDVWRCLKMFEEARKKKRNVKTCFIEIEALSLPLFREKFVKILEEGEGHVGKDSQYTYTI